MVRFFTLGILGIGTVGGLLLWFFDTPAAVVPVSVPNDFLSFDQFKAHEEELIAILNDHNPRVALHEIEVRAMADNRFANSCHAMVHVLGHAAYHKYEDFGTAVFYSEPTCNVGYVHGVAQAHFDHLESITDEALQVCNAYAFDSVIGQECVHGIGHGLMLATDNNVFAALEYCDRFTSVGEQYACYTGAFMENFNTNTLFHPNVFLDDEDPFSLCTTLALPYKSACNHYAVHYYIRANDNDFLKGMSRCGQLAYFDRPHCARGVGDLAIKEHIAEPLLVAALCESVASESMRKSCIEGMTSLYVNQYGSLENGSRLCENLSNEASLWCTAVVDSYPDDYYDMII